MNVVIFCGGKGTRLGKTENLPKPLVKIDNKYPILRHLMMHFAKQGFCKFTLLCGYRIEEFYKFRESWMIPNSWEVDILDTGEDTQTGGRVYRYIQDQLNKNEAQSKCNKYLPRKIQVETFFLTYGDGIAPIDLISLYDTHIENSRPVTITAVHPPSRFGLMEVNGSLVTSFSEKPSNTGWINGGFMLIDQKALLPYYDSVIDKDACNFEKDILPTIARNRNITAFKHEGFWQCMDTPRDVEFLRSLRKEKKWKEIFE